MKKNIVLVMFFLLMLSGVVLADYVLDINQQSKLVEVEKGQEVDTKITFMNLDEQTARVLLRVVNPPEDLQILVNQKNFSVNYGEKKEVILSFKDDKREIDSYIILISGEVNWNIDESTILKKEFEIRYGVNVVEDREKIFYESTKNFVFNKKFYIFSIGLTLFLIIFVIYLAKKLKRKTEISKKRKKKL